MTQYPSGIVKAMLPAIDSILSIRDQLGAVIRPVSFLTRTWSGTEPGSGTATDSVVQLLPTPKIKEFSQDVRLREGGNIRAGDIILMGISRNKYTYQDLDSVTASKSVEKFFMVGDKIYQIIQVTEKYVTFDVHIRELTNQARY